MLDEDDEGEGMSDGEDEGEDDGLEVAGGAGSWGWPPLVQQKEKIRWR